MFCAKCGNQMPENSKICSACGADLSGQSTLYSGSNQFNTGSSTNQGYTGSNANMGYAGGNVNQSSGGWNTQQNYYQGGSQQGANTTSSGYQHPYHSLGGLLAFFTYIDLLYAGFLVIATIFRLLGGLGLAFIEEYDGTVNNLIRAMINTFLIILHIRLFVAVIRKDPSFLSIYEILAACSVALNLIAVFFHGKGLVSTIIVLAISFGIMFAYYTKSVRVRTYFGTDEYLRKSRLFKNAPSPTPADGSFGGGYH